MDRVNIYMYTSVKGPGTRAGSYTYLLEYITEKGPATLSKSGELEKATEHQANLLVLTEALARIRRACEVVVFTDSQYLQSGIEKWLKKWRSGGWITAKGKPVANKEEWEKVAGLLDRHLVTVSPEGRHEYREWIRRETENKEKERKECLKGSGNLIPHRR